MTKERKNEAIWNIFRESGVLMAVCGDMTSRDENELYDEIASAVEAERARISDEIIKAIGASKLGILKNKTTLEVLKDILSIINPSKE